MTSYFPTTILCQQTIFLGCAQLQAGGLQLGKDLRKPGDVAFSRMPASLLARPKAGSCPLYWDL